MSFNFFGPQQAMDFWRKQSNNPFAGQQQGSKEDYTAESGNPFAAQQAASFQQPAPIQAPVQPVQSANPVQPVRPSALQQLQDNAQQAPQYGDYKPSTLTRILAALAGGLARDPNVTSGIMNSKYNHAMRDFQTRQGALGQAAQFETQGNKIQQTGDIAGMRNDTDRERLVVQERIATENRLSRAEQFESLAGHRQAALEAEIEKGNQQAQIELDKLTEQRKENQRDYEIARGQLADSQKRTGSMVSNTQSLIEDRGIDNTPSSAYLNQADAAEYNGMLAMMRDPNQIGRVNTRRFGTLKQKIDAAKAQRTGYGVSPNGGR